MSNLETKTSVTVSFHGVDLEKNLQANPDLVRTAWDLCSKHTTGSIRVDVSPRLTDANPVEWTLCVSSPKGRQTAVLTQRKPGGHVAVTAA